MLVLCAVPAVLSWRHRPRSPTAVLERPREPPPLERGRRRAGAGDHTLAAAFERGIAAYNADDAEAAMDAFEEAVRLAPAEPEAHINLGLVYLRLQRPEDAMRELTKGASLSKGRGR
jgi:tetratricopeptide (TPR) repeat protein